MANILDEFDYFIVMFQITNETVTAKHLCGYMNPIRDIDIEDLKRELLEDSSFDFSKEDIKNSTFIPITKYEVECIMNGYDLPQTIIKKLNLDEEEEEPIDN